jgi:hypothetical protein
VHTSAHSLLLSPPCRTTEAQQKAGWAGKSATERLAKLDHGKECIDLESGCSDWAIDGECQKNKAYMAVNCAKSCHFC